MAAGAWVEARAFVVRRVRVPVLPPGRRELRVLHISDIHLMGHQNRKREFVSRLAGLRPDLVIDTGDNISQPSALAPLLTALGELLRRPGAFVFGSNDLSAPRFRNPIGYLFGNSRPHRVESPEMPWRRMRDAFTAAGWVYLENRSARLQVAGLTIDLRGTGDAHHDLDD